MKSKTELLEKLNNKLYANEYVFIHEYYTSKEDNLKEYRQIKQAIRESELLDDDYIIGDNNLGMP